MAAAAGELRKTLLEAGRWVRPLAEWIESEGLVLFLDIADESRVAGQG